MKILRQGAFINIVVRTYIRHIFDTICILFSKLHFVLFITSVIVLGIGRLLP